MRLRLKKDLVIPAGTVMTGDGVPNATTRDASAFISHLIPFGSNATGELLIGHEVGDAQFDEWFEEAL